MICCMLLYVLASVPQSLEQAGHAAISSKFVAMGDRQTVTIYTHNGELVATRNGVYSYIGAIGDSVVVSSPRDKATHIYNGEWVTIQNVYPRALQEIGFDIWAMPYFDSSPHGFSVSPMDVSGNDKRVIARIDLDPNRKTWRQLGPPVLPVNEYDHRAKFNWKLFWTVPYMGRTAFIRQGEPNLYLLMDSGEADIYPLRFDRFETRVKPLREGLMTQEEMLTAMIQSAYSNSRIEGAWAVGTNILVQYVDPGFPEPPRRVAVFDQRLKLVVTKEFAPLIIGIRDGMVFFYGGDSFAQSESKRITE